MSYKLNEKERANLDSIINTKLSIKVLRKDVIEYLKELYNQDDDYSELKPYLGKKVIVYHEVIWRRDGNSVLDIGDYFILENNNIRLTLECFEFRNKYSQYKDGAAV